MSLVVVVGSSAGYAASRYFGDLSAYSGLGYAGVFAVTLLANASLLPTPTYGAIAVAGAVLSPGLVAIVGALGAATGQLAGYTVGRGARSANMISGHRLRARFDSWIRRRPFVTLFLLCAIPNPFFGAASVIAGATKYSIYRYWVAVALGKLPIYFVAASLGDTVWLHIGRH